MRVLDLGTGAGDVALLAARIVGPSGRVVSVDRDLRTLMLAAVRCEREEIEHVDLAVGDLAVPVLPEGGFDAVVARSVLLDLPDPARTLRAAAARLRPGGVVCIQEAAESPCRRPRRACAARSPPPGSPRRPCATARVRPSARGRGSPPPDAASGRDRVGRELGVDPRRAVAVRAPHDREERLVELELARPAVAASRRVRVRRRSSACRSRSCG